MTSKYEPTHVVVDGSNIATEGRSVPSLAQLSDAVMSFMEEHPNTAITVVVDATFGHRIDKKETSEFEAGISNNELVAPPAGAIGRGDAFVLSIAQKAKASILSNDSFQEFHADYEWLFDEGRLIGGKPVPHVGWVFVNRSPVRGPVSRKATQGARGRGGSRGSDGGRVPKPLASGSPLANEPMPVPKSPPPGRSRTRSADLTAADAASHSVATQPAPRAGEVVNELMPFLEFVEHHPIGTSVNGTVESYSSHGAYLSIGSDGVRGYVPLRLMAEPAPTSARKVMQIGEAVTVVVVSFAAARRSIDCALPDMASRAAAVLDDNMPAESAPSATRKRATASSAATKTAATTNSPKKTAAKKTAGRKTAAKKTAGKEAAAKKVAAKDVAAKKTATRKTAVKKTAVTKTAVTKTAANVVAANVVAAKDVAVKHPARKAANTSPAANKSAAAKSAPMRPAAKKSAATKTTAATKNQATRETAATTAPTKRKGPAPTPRQKSAAVAVSADAS